MKKTLSPTPDPMMARMLLEEIRSQLGVLQESSGQTGLSLQEIRVNTKTLLPLLALLEAPDPEELSLGHSLERALASIRDRLQAIESQLLTPAALEMQLATHLGPLSHRLQRMEVMQAAQNRRLQALSTDVAALFADEDLPVS